MRSRGHSGWQVVILSQARNEQAKDLAACLIARSPRPALIDHAGERVMAVTPCLTGSTVGEASATWPAIRQPVVVRTDHQAMGTGGPRFGPWGARASPLTLLRARLTGAPRRTTTPVPLCSAGGSDSRAVLTDWPIARRGDWLRRVNRAETKRELEALRRSVARGQPFGTETWCKRVIKRLGLESTVRPRGRPRTHPEQ